MIASLTVTAFACGGKGGGSDRPGKVKTIVGNVPKGYEASVAASLGYWSSRWQVMQYALMSGAGTTTTIDANEMDWLRYLTEPSNGSDLAVPPTNAAYLLVPFRYGFPTYANPSDGSFSDYGDERWSGAEPTSGNSALLSAYLIFAETEWARQFHYVTPFGSPESSTFGATERLTGLIFAELAKRSAMHFINNRASYTEDDAARFKMIASLANLARLLRDPTIDGATNNRYRDVNFASQLMAWTDFIFDELTSSPSPTTADGLANAITCLGYFVTTTLDESHRDSATAIIRHNADSLYEYDTTDTFDNACRIRGLMEAGRLLLDNSYYSKAAEVFTALKASYVPATGIFTDRQAFTSYEISQIVGALNQLRTLGKGYADVDWAELIMSDFIAASVYLPKLYRSTFPASVISSFERPADSLNYLFPDIPEHRDLTAGFAPHFASRIIRKPDNTGWKLDSPTFDAVGAMSLAIELLWLRPNSFFPYPLYSGGVSSPLRFGRGDFTFPVAMSEAYFTGRTAVLEFALRSSIGETFQLSPDVAGDIVSRVSTPTLNDVATMPLNMYLIRSPFNLASPAYRGPFNSNYNDYENFRWTNIGTDKNQESLAALMLVHTRLARHFGDSRRFGTSGTSSFGANERMKGLILFHGLKKQVADLFDNTYNLPRTTTGSALLLEALCEAADLFSADTLPDGKDNIYADVISYMKANEIIEDLFEFLASSTLPSDISRMRQVERGLFRYALFVPDFDRARAARAMVINIASNANGLTPSDAREKADQFLLFFDAVRMNAGGEFAAELRKAFVLLLNEYDPSYGYFSSRTRYSSSDVASILEALLCANTWSESFIDLETSRNLLRGFIEGTLMMSGMVRSAWAPWEYPAYERKEADIYYRYPTLPYPLYAGGDNGIAPVLAGQIEFVPFGSYWNMLDTLSSTYGLLSACDVMLRCNTVEIPPLEVPSYLK